MTTTAAHVLAVAEAEVGYEESGGRSGHNGNITKYWAKECPSCQGQPWCACFVRWTDQVAGGPVLPIANPYYCPSIVTYARQHGLWSPNSGAAGDYVLYDFSGHGVAEHIGRLRAPWQRGQNDSAVEGNTMPSDGGDQANGGGVYNRTRPSSCILGVVRYSTLLAATPAHPVTPAPRNPVKHNPYPQPKPTFRRGCTPDGPHGTRTRYVQWAVGCPVDGTFGDQTDHAVRLFQKQHGLAIDGVVGPATLAQLAKITH